MDTEECRKIFNVLDMEKEGEEDISFCRRIGEKGGAEPRPLVVVLRTEEAKRKLLGRAKNLRDAIFQEVGIVPDLTVAQRREEHQLSDEAERRNEEELTQEDISKNLKWLVVGQRGAKKLIKAVPREHQGRRGGRGPKGNRGGNWPRRAGARGGLTTGANATALGVAGRGGVNIIPLNPPPPLNLLPQTELLPSENRMRTANKRNRDEAEEDTAEMGEESEYEEAEERSPA